MGLFLWAIGCFGTGMAMGYKWLLAFRIVTGIGSAAIVTLATPFVDDISPASAKTLWFGLLYLVSHSEPCARDHSVMTAVGHGILSVDIQPS